MRHNIVLCASHLTFRTHLCFRTTQTHFRRHFIGSLNHPSGRISESPQNKEGSLLIVPMQSFKEICWCSVLPSEQENRKCLVLVWRHHLKVDVCVKWQRCWKWSACLLSQTSDVFQPFLLLPGALQTDIWPIQAIVPLSMAIFNMWVVVIAGSVSFSCLAVCVYLFWHSNFKFFI